MSHAPSIPASFSRAPESAATPAIAIGCTLNGVAAPTTLGAPLSTGAGNVWFSFYTVPIPAGTPQPLLVVVTALENGAPPAGIVKVPGVSELRF